MRKLFGYWFWGTIALSIYSYHAHATSPDMVAISYGEAFASVIVGEIILGGAALTFLAPFTWPILGILFFARSKKTLDHVDEHFDHKFKEQMHHHRQHPFNHKMHKAKRIN